MLGADVARAAARAGWETTALGHSELDITDADAVARAFERCRAAGGGELRGVDGRRRGGEPSRAGAGLNADGAGNIARAAADGGGAAGARLDRLRVPARLRWMGRGATPRTWSRIRSGPRTAYGETKLAGELQVLAASPAHAVVRTAWLFGVDGTTSRRRCCAWRPSGARRRGAGGRDAGPVPCGVVSDQIGCPTWTGHLAPALIGLMERGVRRPGPPGGRRARLLERVRAGDLPPGGGRVRVSRGDEGGDGASGAAACVVGARVRTRRTCFRCRRGRTAWRATWRRWAWDDPRMKLLVCGGAGFIGSTFARQRLTEHGDEVTCSTSSRTPGARRT